MARTRTGSSGSSSIARSSVGLCRPTSPTRPGAPRERARERLRQVRGELDGPVAPRRARLAGPRPSGISLQGAGAEPVRRERRPGGRVARDRARRPSRAPRWRVAATSLEKLLGEVLAEQVALVGLLARSAGTPSPASAWPGRSFTRSAWTTARAISSWTAKTSVSSRSKVWLQSRSPSLALTTSARDPELVPGAPDAALEQVGDAELPGDLRRLDVLPLEVEGRRPPRHAEPRHLGERREDLLGDAVGEVLLVVLRGEVREGEHGDGRCGARRRSRRRVLGRPLPGVPGAGPGSGDGEHGGGHRERQQEPGPAEARTRRAPWPTASASLPAP